MKNIIIIFGLLYAVHCKPTDTEPSYYLDDGQSDNENYDDTEDEVPEENDAANEEKPVSISTERKTFEKNLNESVLLPCVVSGSNYVQIWRKNGAILFQAHVRMGASHRIEELEDGSLKIKYLEASDAGDYKCTAMVTEQNEADITHTLLIRTPPHIEYLIAKDNKTLLTSGNTLALKCKASGYPQPVISWHKDGERIATTGEELSIDNIKHHNAGKYICLADNKVGDPSPKAIEIKVDFKPIVTIEHISVSSNNDLNTELKCTVRAEPKADVVWKKDQVNIVNSEHTQLSSSKRDHILVIKGLVESDFGTYTCYASNYLGAVTKDVKLVKTPVVRRFLKPKSENKEMVLEWEVQSKTPVLEHELQYRRKGESNWHPSVNPEASQTGNETYTVKYTIKGLDPGDYEIMIRSRNNNGWTKYSEVINFEGVHAKHGHHKSHKKAHRNGKDKQIAQQEVTSHTIEQPAEHQEIVTTKSPQVGAKETSGCTSLTSALTLVNLTFLLVFLIRPPMLRI